MIILTILTIGIYVWAAVTTVEVMAAADNLGRKVYRDYFKGWYNTFQHNGVEWQKEKRNVRKR